MASSYGYVKREVQDMQINWAEVGQNVRSVLDEESRVRQEKKDAFDKQAREYEERVTNPDLLGKDTEFNEGVLKMGADAQEMSMMNSMLLKSGQLKPRDYTIKTQNMIDGTNDVFKVIELYNNLSEEVMAGVDSEELSSDMLDNWATVQDFANFNDNRIIFNPYSGKVNVATMVEDPDNPGGPLIPSKDLRSVQSLGNILKDQVARYKLLDETTEYAEKLKPIIVQKIKSFGGEYKKGTIEKLTTYFGDRGGGFENLTDDEKKELSSELGIDVSEISSIHDAINTWTESQLVSDRNAMSILVDFEVAAPNGESYKAVFNEEDAFDDNGNRKENVILKTVENGRLKYELTDGQIKEAKKALTRQLSAQLDESTEMIAQSFFEKQPDPKDPTAGEKAKASAQKLWNSAYGASTEQKQNILTSLLAASAKIDDGLVGIIPLEDGGLLVEYLNSDKNTTIKWDENISEEGWAALGTEFTGLEDPNEQMAAGGFSGTRNVGKEAFYNTQAVRGGSTRIASSFRDKFIESTGELFLKNEKAPEVVESLKEMFPEGNDLGVRVFDASSAVNNEVRLTIDGWDGDDKYPKDLQFDANTYTDSGAKDELKKALDWLVYALKQSGKNIFMDEFDPPITSIASKEEAAGEDTGGGASDAPKGDDIITK